MPIIPAFKRLKQEDGEFQSNLDYIMRPCLKKKKQKKFCKTLNTKADMSIQLPSIKLTFKRFAEI
jgi:hypothetical protein